MTCSGLHSIYYENHGYDCRKYFPKLIKFVTQHCNINVRSSERLNLSLMLMRPHIWHKLIRVAAFFFSFCAWILAIVYFLDLQRSGVPTYNVAAFYPIRYFDGFLSLAFSFNFVLQKTCSRYVPIMLHCTFPIYYNNYFKKYTS